MNHPPEAVGHLPEAESDEGVEDSGHENQDLAMKLQGGRIERDINMNGSDFCVP